MYEIVGQNIRQKVGRARKENGMRNIIMHKFRLKIWLMGILLVCTLAFLGCGAESNETKGETIKANTYRQISMEEAKEIMATENNYVILDVRRQDEYSEGHIPGAICIPNESIGTDEIAELPDKDQLILVYCRSGNRSKQAAQKLVQLGYTNVVEFGGILDWDGEIVKE